MRAVSLMMGCFKDVTVGAVDVQLSDLSLGYKIIALIDSIMGINPKIDPKENVYYCIDSISEMLDEVPLSSIAFLVANRLSSYQPPWGCVHARAGLQDQKVHELPGARYSLQAGSGVCPLSSPIFHGASDSGYRQ